MPYAAVQVLPDVGERRLLHTMRVLKTTSSHDARHTLINDLHNMCGWYLYLTRSLTVLNDTVHYLNNSVSDENICLSLK